MENNLEINGIHVIVDGEVTESIVAHGANKSIAELWAYILQRGGIKLMAMQAVGESVNFVCQIMAIRKSNPFFTPVDQMVALSQYKNPYQKQVNMGMCDNLNIDLTPETYIEFTVYPGQNLLSLYFDRMA